MDSSPSFNIVVLTLPRFCVFFSPLRVCCEMCMLLCFFFFKKRKTKGKKKSPGLPHGEDTLDHTEGNAITGSQQNPNHRALMLKVSLFNVLNFKDAAQII